MAISHATERPPPRNSHWQFSLRALLAVTTLVALGLMVYRWPWEEVRLEDDDRYAPPKVFITQWRRGWNGQPQKHGREMAMQLSRHRGEERIFANGRCLSIRKFQGGEPVEMLWPQKGVYVPGPLAQHEVRGVWKSALQHGDETVTQRCEWRNSERHGLSIWTAANGQVLQSAEFERGRIVKWNGKPVAEALEQWMAERVENQRYRQALRTPLTKETYEREYDTRGGYVWANAPGELRVHFGFSEDNLRGPTEWLSRYEGRLLGEVLLETALQQSGTLDYRFGAPCVVRICTSELNWVDNTGVSEVTFAADSPAYREWMQEVSSSGLMTGFPAAELRSIFTPNKTIQIDLSRVDHLDDPFVSKLRNTTEDRESAPPGHSRSRRDLLGHILYLARYRCEQRGDTLVVFPQRQP